MLKLPLGFVERNRKIHSISYILSMWRASANCSGSSLRKSIAWHVEGYVCFRTPFAAGQGHMTSLGPQAVISVNMFHLTVHMHLSMSLLYNCGKPWSLKDSTRQEWTKLMRIQLLATPWTAAYQAPPSMGFSRQEYWSRVPLPSLTNSQ